MAYYMAARRGVDSLMDRSLPQSATLPPEVIQSAIKGLMALRELELNETYCLILGSKTSHHCSSSDCPSHNATGPMVPEAHKRVVDRLTDSSLSGTKVLQVLSLSDIYEGDFDEFCGNCVRGWEAGHAGIRKRAWNILRDAFGLES